MMLNRKFDVVCVGILVADIFIPPLSRLPNSGELLLVDDMLLSTGGCAANTGMDMARLGANVSVIGKVGNDIFADFISKELQEKGLDTSGISLSASSPTSRTVILPVMGDDRRFIHAVGANADLKSADIDRDLVSQAKILYVGGYLLFPGIEPTALADLFKFARKNNTKTVLDVAGPNRDDGLDSLLPVLPYTDVFLPNYDEAKILTGEDSPIDQARLFVDKGAGITIITLGEKGIVVSTKEETFHASAYQIDFVDGSGAGDAFDAGYIIGMLNEWDLQRTIKFASAIGASACTQLGTTGGVFYMEEAQEYIERNKIEIQIIEAR